MYQVLVNVTKAINTILILTSSNNIWYINNFYRLYIPYFCQIKLVEPVKARQDAASTAPYKDQHLSPAFILNKDGPEV